MVNNSSQQRVQKQMLWIMIGCFLWVTYFNFQGFFKGIFSYFTALPTWWLLVVLPIFGLAVIWSIHRGDKEIKEAEASWIESQRRFVEIERQFRLIKTNFLKISSPQFIYYCSDLLKVLGYQNVELLSVNSMLQAINPSGDKIMVYCLHGTEDLLFDKEAIKTLVAMMAEQNIQVGLFMTTADVGDEAREFAKEHGIQCYNGMAISKLVWLAIEEYKEKAQS